MDTVEHDVVACPDCRVFDPANQPSVARRLDAGWDPEVWTLRNGMTFSWPGGSAPLHSDFTPCETHLVALRAAYPVATPHQS